MLPQRVAAGVPACRLSSQRRLLLSGEAVFVTTSRLADLSRQGRLLLLYRRKFAPVFSVRFFQKADESGWLTVPPTVNGVAIR